MIEAIVAGVLTAVIALVIIGVVLAVRHRRAPKVESKTVKQVETYGVGSSPFESTALANKRGEVRVNDSHDSVVKPAEGLNRRFLALGVFGAAIFGSLAAKLWSLQLLSGSAYSAEAEDNLYTTVATPAPRGLIYDRNGVVLASNRPSQTVLADASVAESRDDTRRLSTVLGIPEGVVRARIKDATGGAQNQRVVASDVRLRDVAYISEHADAFPGVSVEERMVRDYPYGALAAHAIGYTGAPTADQLDKELAGRDIQAGDTIGLSGLEAYYDNLLSGDHGVRRVKVDSHGNVIDVVSETRPAKGSDLHLTIDAQLQYVADSLLASTIAPKGIIGEGTGAAGAALVMDVRDGSVLAMASYPTFDPTYFSGGIPTDIWDLYNTEESYAPLNNRVVHGLYPVASTFKAFTSLASLEYGLADAEKDKWVCGGAWDGFGTGQIQKCWETSGHGELSLKGGIINSCDIVFYDLGKKFYDHGPEGTGELSDTALQDYLARFNFDVPTGIDLANEASGRIPTPAWKKEYYQNRPADAIWRGGDYSNMMIGQGDVLATPIELAVAYGAIATGDIVKPHLLKEVRNSSDGVVFAAEREVVSTPEVQPEHMAFIRDALRAVIADNPTNASHFRNISVALAGKSGSAQHGDRNSDAWFVSYGPFEDPHYVVVVVVEQGGFGSTCAAPLNASLMEAALRREAGEDLKLEPVHGSSGKSTDTIGGTSGRGD